MLRKIHSTQLANRLDTLPFASFVLNRPPMWAFVMLVTISPLAFFVLNASILGIWVPPQNQWKSALIGDVMLSLWGTGNIAALAELSAANPLADYRVLKRRWQHYGVVCLWLGVALLHMWQERHSVPTMQRRMGATSLYHTFVVYPLFGYVLTILCLALLRYQTLGGRLLTVVLLVVFVGSWAYLGVYDAHHQLAPNGVDKHVYSSPSDGWRNVRLLVEWLRHRW